MNYLAGITLAAAAFSFTSLTHAQEPAPIDPEVRHVIALADANDADAGVAIAAVVLDAYEGRYETESGASFIVVRHEDFLTIEAPESLGLEPLRLRPTTPRDFVAAQAGVSVTFDVDDNGRVRGLVIGASKGAPTLAALAVLRQGIVTIHDVYEQAATLEVAASN